MFQDRLDAGRQLVKPLLEFSAKADTLVVALPRGGVMVGWQIAKELNLPLEIVCPRKIGAPGNPEYALGAITETGDGIFCEGLIKELKISKEYIEHTVKQEKAEALRRLNLYRKNRKDRDFKGKTILLVDDGLATGSTMLAAIESIKAMGATSIVVAVPVAPQESVARVKGCVDQIVCLEAVEEFYALSQFYHDFAQVTDAEVIEILN